MKKPLFLRQGLFLYRFGHGLVTRERWYEWSNLVSSSKGLGDWGDVAKPDGKNPEVRGFADLRCLQGPGILSNHLAGWEGR